MRRVVVTGMGVVSSIGRDLKEFWSNLGKLNSGLVLIGKGDLGGFNLNDKKFAGKVEISQSDLENLTFARNKQNGMALIAAKNAIIDSGVNIVNGNKGRVAVIVGADKSQLSPALFFAEEVNKESPRLVNSEFYKHLSVTGPCFNISNMIESQGASFGCGSGLGSIGAGMMNIVDDEADIVLAGNTEQSVHPYLLKSEQVQGDGSAVIILEDLKHALARNAKIYAEIKSFSQIHEKNTEKALNRSIQLTLQKAGLSPDSLNLLVHNTESIPKNFILSSSCLLANPQTYFGSTTGGLGTVYLAVSLLIMLHNSIPNSLLFSDCKELGYKKIDPENILCVTHGLNNISSSILLSKYKP